MDRLEKETVAKLFPTFHAFLAIATEAHDRLQARAGAPTMQLRQTSSLLKLLEKGGPLKFPTAPNSPAPNRPNLAPWLEPAQVILGGH